MVVKCWFGSCFWVISFLWCCVFVSIEVGYLGDWVEFGYWCFVGF